MSNLPIISADNSTTTPLNPTSSWTGSFEDASRYPSVTFSMLTDTSGSIVAEFSPDAVNIDSKLTYVYESGSNEFHRLTVTRKYFRLKVFNASTSSQSYLRLQTLLGGQTQVSSPLNFSIQQDADAVVTRPISSDITMALGLFNGYITDTKYGRIQNVTDGSDIWDGGGVYTGFPTGSAEKVQVFSGNTNDTVAGTGARTIKIYGLDEDYDLQEETFSLNGTTPVTSSYLWHRVNRMQVLTAGSSGQNLGSLICRHNTTTSNVFVSMSIGLNQTAQATYTVPRRYKMVIRRIHVAGARTNNTIIGDFSLRTRESGSVFRASRLYTAGNGIVSDLPYEFGIPFPPKTDVKLRCDSVSAGSGDFVGEFEFFLFKII